MSRNTYIILVLLLAVSALVNWFRPGGLMAYLFPSICWVILASVALKFCGFERIRSWFNKRVFFMAALVGVFQIVALIDVGLVTGFGRSPQTFTLRGLLATSIYAFSPLLGMELSRGYLLKTIGKKRPVLTLGLVTLLYSFITISIIGLTTILTSNDPLLISDFIGSRFLPTVTENLLASYLALIAGPIASLAYRAPLTAFEWFFPILPDLTWGFESLINVMAPTIGFVVISQAAPAELLKKIGIPTETKRPRIFSEAKKPSAKGWTIISVLCVLLVWASTGLLGFYPTIIASGSMKPTMEVGDIAISVSVDPSTIHAEDIIQYWQEEEMIIHRVTDIRLEGGTRLFQTKGDANREPDTELVNPTQIRGKLILTIPKLGWISIHIKTAITSIWSFFLANTMIAYATLTTLVLMASTYTVHAYKSRSHTHWKRKGGWPRK